MAILKTDSGSLGVTLTAGASSRRQAILSPASILGDRSEMLKYYEVGVNFQIESVVVIHNLPSLNKISPPEIFPEDSDALKLRKRLAVEDNAQKMGVLFSVSDTIGGVWRDLYLLKLINFGTEIAQEVLPSIGAYDTKRLSPGASFGIQLVDLGHGLLSSGDRVTIEISWAYQLDGFLRNPYRSQQVAIEGQFVPGPYGEPQRVAIGPVSTQLVAAGIDNKYLNLYNDGPDAVLLRIGGNALLSSYNMVIPPGANYWDFRIGSQQVSTIVKSGGTSASLMVAVASEVFSKSV
ncbi:MAG: hypothetical protein SXA11_06935 [Cyanobacteriota bacterium]|nr:hypothetical protein [Cyanobacteriota bacterium]